MAKKSLTDISQVSNALRPSLTEDDLRKDLNQCMGSYSLPEDIIGSHCNVHRGFAECTDGRVNNETAKEKKKMLHWDSDFAYITHNGIVALMNGGIVMPPNAETLLYTGLLDENGKEICEGDITRREIGHFGEFVCKVFRNNGGLFHEPIKHELYRSSLYRNTLFIQR